MPRTTHIEDTLGYLMEAPESEGNSIGEDDRNSLTAAMDYGDSPSKPRKPALGVPGGLPGGVQDDPLINPTQNNTHNQPYNNASPEDQYYIIKNGQVTLHSYQSVLDYVEAVGDSKILRILPATPELWADRSLILKANIISPKKVTTYRLDIA